MRVRMGIHTGEAARRASATSGSASIAPRGSELPRTAVRCCSRLDPRAGRGRPARGVVLRDLGAHRLKDIDRPERLFQLAADGLPTEFPPLGARRSRRAAPAAAPGRSCSRALAGVIAAAVAIPIFAFGRRRSGSVAGRRSSERRRLRRLRTRAGSSPRSRSRRDARRASRSARARSGSRTPTATRVSRIDPTTNTVRADDPVGSGPSGIAIGGGFVWVTNSLDGTVSRIDPDDEHGRRRRSPSATARRDRVRRRLDLGREHRRRHAHEDRRRAAASSSEDACRSRRPSSPFGGGALWASRENGEPRRADRPEDAARSCRRSPSGTGRRGSPSAQARSGSRTASTARSRGSIRRRTPSAATIPTGNGPTAVAAERARRLGQQPVRRHARADRSDARTRSRGGSRSATARRVSRSPTGPCSSASASPAPRTAAAR